MSKFNLAIIGSSRIAQIHYKFLKEYNFSKIFFVGRNTKKILNFLNKNKIFKVTTIEKKKKLTKNFLI